MISKQSIAERAYQLWNARGRPHGSEEEDWLEAERQLGAAQQASRNDLASESELDTSLKDTFPASDPPASRLPDEPPSNAEEKWVNTGAARPPTPPAPKPRSRSSTAKKAKRGRSPTNSAPTDETDAGPATTPGDGGEG